MKTENHPKNNCNDLESYIKKYFRHKMTQICSNGPSFTAASVPHLHKKSPSIQKVTISTKSHHLYKKSPSPQKVTIYTKSHHLHEKLPSSVIIDKI